MLRYYQASTAQCIRGDELSLLPRVDKWNLVKLHLNIKSVNLVINIFGILNQLIYLKFTEALEEFLYHEYQTSLNKRDEAIPFFLNFWVIRFVLNMSTNASCYLYLIDSGFTCHDKHVADDSRLLYYFSITKN